MPSDWRTLLREQLVRQEGVKPRPYMDTQGKITIGVGRNLSDKGLRADEISLILDHDITDAEDDARALLGDAIFTALSDTRKAVVVNMAFNLGLKRLSRFVQYLAAVKSGQYQIAAQQMLSSQWASQVGQRAQELSQLMESG